MLAAIESSSSRLKRGAQTVSSGDSLSLLSSATYPAASNVCGAPLTATSPTSSSDACARWYPSIGTRATLCPSAASFAVSVSAYVDLPAPGAPVTPRMARRLLLANSVARAKAVVGSSCRGVIPRSCQTLSSANVRPDLREVALVLLVDQTTHNRTD